MIYGVFEEKEEIRMKVRKKRTLLLIACLVWGAAGINILRIGLMAYPAYVSVLNVVLFSGGVRGVPVFCVRAAGEKHTRRITGVSGGATVFSEILDLKAFAIMAFMMTFGILLRTTGLGPERFIAVFYSGLGASLLLAGLLFGRNYVCQLRG